MPKSRRPKPLYQRGIYALYAREGRNLEIVWYDSERKRERGISAGTTDLEAGRLALDRHFLQQTGARHCPTCHRPWDAEQSPLLLSAIADYLILMDGRAGEKAARGRLRHVVDYLEQQPDSRCAAVDERWVDGFRKALLAKPVTVKRRDGTETSKPRALGAVEGCVLQLAAAINATPGQRAQFQAVQPKDVARSPAHRADVTALAAMFNYCLRPSDASTTHHFQTKPNEKLLDLRIKERANLLRYLRMAVATWARPDAIFEVRAPQWYSAARVLDLNQQNRKQTKKHRPKVPIAKQFAPFLDSGDAFLGVTTVRSSWEKMRAELGMPAGGEAGEKLVRRSMATLARKRIGEANWRQGEMMLGHVKTSVSDIYALPDPANLGLALAATESIIDEIDQLAPGAFYRNVTANGRLLGVVDGGLSA